MFRPYTGFWWWAQRHLMDTNIGVHKLISITKKCPKLHHLGTKKGWSGSRARVGSEVPVMMCYGGGRNLKRQAPVIEVVVLDPANLQVELRSKKVKTDRLDAERMIRAIQHQSR